MTDTAHSLHMQGDHGLCDYLHCEERQAEESANSDAMYAKAVLLAIARRGANSREILGGCQRDSDKSRSLYDLYRELATSRQPDYLDQRPGASAVIKANMNVREAMKGIPVIWEFETPVEVEEEDDFDVDAFFDALEDH